MKHVIATRIENDKNVPFLVVRTYSILDVPPCTLKTFEPDVPNRL